MLGVEGSLEMVKKGFFVCIEGLDGCGKTTQTKLLVRNLRRKDYDAVYTAEPSQGKIGKFIKKYCLHGRKRVSSVVEALLFAADRFEHVENEIFPNLREGKIVISDRYVYSSLAYQGAVGLDLGWIRRLNERAMRPNLAIYVDCDLKLAAARMKPRKSVMEDLETQQKVREIYMTFVEKGELVRIDGNGSKTEVADDMRRVVLSALQHTH